MMESIYLLLLLLLLLRFLVTVVVFKKEKTMVQKSVNPRMREKKG
jgi:hypothetical protein